MAFQYKQTKGSSPLAIIDERAPINPTVADSSRSADEDEDEDVRNDEMSEPSQITMAEKRKKIQMDETTKDIRVLLLLADSSLASSLRLSDETQEQLVRSSKQASTVKKGVETLQDVSYLFLKGQCEQQRNGFLQERKAGV